METKRGFTVIELLTVLVIIAILTSILMPSIKMVRNMAKETKVSAQLGAIGMGLAAFRNDYGDYPPSDSSADVDYTGAQMLCEALFGWDLMGFHPDSVWRQNEFTSTGSDVYISNDEVNLKQRKDRYLEIEQSNVYRLDEIFDNADLVSKNITPDTYVICDSFGVKNYTNQATKKTFKIGTPILYYKADPTNKTQPYYWQDNQALLSLGTVKDGKLHDLADPNPTNSYKNFYDFIIDDDKSTTNRTVYYRPDSYLLISAGIDGIYGTDDDITNFGN